MSSPRDRDAFDDRPGEGAGWQEPAHLGNGGENPEPGDPPPTPDPGAAADPAPGTAADGTPSRPGPSGWEPAGWSLPPAEPPRPAGRPEGEPVPPPWPAPQTGDAAARPDAGAQAGQGPADPRTYQEPQPWQRDGQLGGFLRRGRPRPERVVEQVFAYQGDVVGAQGWALQNGWTISDGSTPADAVLRDLIAAGPVRLSKDHRPASVMRGRYGSLDLVAFDVVYASGRYLVPEYAVTAAPLLLPLPQLRLTPTRFWKHRTGGLLQIPSGNEQFDARWLLLAAEDGPVVRRIGQDPALQALLLGSDDGDEFWSAAGHVAAVRPDGHRPQLVEHHARLLTAVVAAVTAGA